MNQRCGSDAALVSQLTQRAFDCGFLPDLDTRERSGERKVRIAVRAGNARFDPVPGVVPDDLASFQTWHSTGLPNWPIDSPSVASLEAAFAPDTDDRYIFFVAKCDTSGAHWFSKTLAEHNQPVLECQDR